MGRISSSSLFWGCAVDQEISNVVGNLYTGGCTFTHQNQEYIIKGSNFDITVPEDGAPYFTKTGTKLEPGYTYTQSGRIQRVVMSVVIAVILCLPKYFLGI